MVRLKFTFKYIYDLIRKNKIKIILLLIVIISINVINRLDNRLAKHKVIDKFTHLDNMVYVTWTYNNGDIEYNTNYYIIGDENIKLIDKLGLITTIEFTSFKIFLILLSIILSIVITLSSFSDEESGWDFIGIYNTCLCKEVKRYQDTNKMYLVYSGRVIHTQSISGDLYTIPQLYNNSLLTIIMEFKENPNLYPVYKGTKSEIRDNKIDDIIA